MSKSTKSKSSAAPRVKKTAALKKAAVKKAAAAKKPAAPAKKKSVSAKAAAPVKKTVKKVKKVAAKKPAVKKPVAKKPAVKKTAAKKPILKKVATEKSAPVKKAAVKKVVAVTKKAAPAKKAVAKKKAVKKKETLARRACPVELLTFSVALDEDEEKYVVHSAPEINKAHKLKVPKKSATWFEITEDSEPLQFYVNFTMKDGEGSGSSSNDNEEMGDFDFNTLQDFYGLNETKGLPQSIRWASLLGYAATFDMKKTKGGIKVRLSTVIIELKDQETILQRC